MESQLLLEEHEINDSKSKDAAMSIFNLGNHTIWAIRYHQQLISVQSLEELQSSIWDKAFLPAWMLLIKKKKKS